MTEEPKEEPVKITMCIRCGRPQYEAGDWSHEPLTKDVVTALRNAPDTYISDTWCPKCSAEVQREL